MKRIDKVLYISSFMIILLTGVTTIFLPANISLAFSKVNEKSKYYLLLLSIIPIVVTYILSKTELSNKIAVAFNIGVPIYILLIVLHSFGIVIPFEALILLILSIAMLFIALLIKDEKSNVKISLKYVSSKEIYNKLQKLGFIMFFTLFIEMLVMSILVLINILSPVISIPVIIITGFIFSLLILKMSIKEK
ncbi:MAG: hypothetical protein PUC01_03945 [Spirochaetales bacterium]|nr:hypothetical protein [Spirochaetales bacterium]